MREDVYNLEVDEHHNFFANDIVVHNCIDATRYAFNNDMKSRNGTGLIGIKGGI